MNDTAEPSLESSDLGLIARVKSGDQRACETFVLRFGPRMVSVARRFFRSDDDVNDAVQDAFISALGSLDRFEGKSGMATWLHRITVNACLMKLRRVSHEESIEPLLPTFDDTGHHTAHPQQWGDHVVEAAER